MKSDEDLLDELEREIEELCSDREDPACDMAEQAVKNLAEDRYSGVVPMSPNEFTSGPHSYRGFSPDMVPRLIASVGTEAGEMGTEKTAVSVMRYIESGRLVDALEAASRMFNRLDNDEMELFTQRNPDVVEWITVYDEAVGFNPQPEWRQMARDNLTGGNDGRYEADNPPLFSRERGSATRKRGVVSDMASRRRSYRNWTPQEFQEVLDMEVIELSRGLAREIDYQNAEIRENIDFPHEVPAKEVVRQLLSRVEGGRFQEMLSEMMSFYAPLDPDERRMFSRRNPGLTMWLSVFGESEHLIHQDQLLAHTYPTLREE